MRGSNTLKNILTTTALAATLIFVNSGSAKADESNAWSGMTMVDGQASIDYSIPQITTITQSSLRAIGEASSLDILKDQTVNIFQSSNDAWFIARAVGDNDKPALIIGNMNANGNVMVIDRNGVFFGKDSIINVGSIIASTGDLSNADFMDGDGRFEFSNFGDGKIENQGTITVADAGLAAFVSPFVSNSGTINAKLGKVAFASGSKVTLDLYGDGLVEIAAGDKLSDALIDNTGKINAEGGNVVITANAAKAAVDNVINMDGVVDVSSVSVKGGKIILNGGSQGKVAVKGKLNASGKTGGGFIETSGAELEVSEAASVDASSSDGVGGLWLIDPLSILIANSAAGFSNYTFVNAGTVSTSLSGGTNVTLQTGLNSTSTLGGHNDGDIRVRSHITNSGVADSTLTLIAHDDILLENNADIKATGAGKLNVTLTSADDVSIGSGSDIEAKGGNILINNGGSFFSVDSDSLHTAGLGTITLNQDDGGDIQDAVDALDNDGTGLNTIFVKSGTYNESVTIDEDNILLSGANAGINPNTGVRGAESLIKFAGFAGVRVRHADNVTVDGFSIRKSFGDGEGIWLDNATNSTAKNNFITKVGHGVRAGHGFGNTIAGNKIVDTSHDGIRAQDDNGLDILNNVIVDTGGDGMELGYSDDLLVSGNSIDTTKDDGIDVERGSNVTISGNTITNVKENGMELENSAGVLVKDNTITNSPEDGIYANDIYGSVLDDYGYATGHALEVIGNTITTTGDDGIEVLNSGATLIRDNVISHAGYGNGGDYGGADKYGADGIHVRNTHFDGYGEEMKSFAYGEDYTDYAVEILSNIIEETGDDGIEVLDSGRTLIADNDITDAGRDFEYAYDDYYCYAYGECGGSNDGDGIHVENVFAQDIRAGRFDSYDYSYGDDGYSVQILDNVIDTTGDDGIEVLRSGKTLIAGNEIDNAGLLFYGYPTLQAFFSEGDEYSYDEEYGYETWNPDADGIHVANVYTQNIYQYGENEEGFYTRPYSVEIIGNDINNVGDDGIEVLGSENVYNDFYDCYECGYSNTGRTLIQDNVVNNTGLADGYAILSFDSWYGDNGSHGITVEDIYGDYGYDGYSVEIVGNTVDNAENSGIRIENVDTSLTSGNTVSNSGEYGFFSAGAYNDDVVVAGNTFNNNPVGARFESGERIDLTGATNTINGGDVGLQFEPYYTYGNDLMDGGMNLVNDTIGTTVFNGQSEFYVELQFGAFFAPGFPTVLDGTDATYDGVHPIETGNVLTQGQYDEIEAKIYDFLDQDNRGLFFFGLAGNNPDIGQEDIFRTVDPFAPQFGSLNVTILGLPNTGAGGGGGQGGAGGGTGGGLNLANIEPAAGEEEGQGTGAPQNIEPAAGGEGGTQGGQNAACWNDAVNGVQTNGQPTTLDFSTDPSETLQDVAACGGAPQQL